MKLGLVGYFGWGNYGDELFVEVYRKYFPDAEFIYFHDTEKKVFVDDIDKRIDSVDAILIGGGDLLIPGVKSWLYWDERYLRKPVFVFGVGVPTWVTGVDSVVQHYRQFLQHPNIKLIGLRDEQSAQWVRQRIAPTAPVAVYPDMVLALPIPKPEVEKDTIGLVVRHQANFKTPADVPQVIDIGAVARRNGLKVKNIVLGTGDTYTDDFSQIHLYDGLGEQEIVVRDSISELTKELLSCSYVMSMKFHGCVVAYAGRVPVCGLSGADKFKSFFQDADMSRFQVPSNNQYISEKLQRLVDGYFHFDRHSELLERSAEGCEFLVKRVFEI